MENLQIIFLLRTIFLEEFNSDADWEMFCGVETKYEEYVSEFYLI